MNWIIWKVFYDSQMHALVRADGIGDWATSLDAMLMGPSSQFILDDFRVIQRELVQRHAEGTWQYVAAKSGTESGVLCGSRPAVIGKMGVRAKPLASPHTAADGGPAARYSSAAPLAVSGGAAPPLSLLVWRQAQHGHRHDQVRLGLPRTRS